MSAAGVSQFSGPEGKQLRLGSARCERAVAGGFSHSPPNLASREAATLTGALQCGVVAGFGFGLRLWSQLLAGRDYYYRSSEGSVCFVGVRSGWAGTAGRSGLAAAGCLLLACAVRRVDGGGGGQSGEECERNLRETDEQAQRVCWLTRRRPTKREWQP